MGAHLKRHIGCLLLLAGLLGATAGPTPAAARADEPGVSTLWPVDLTGTIEVSGAADAAFLRGDEAAARTRIQAEEVLIEVTWEQGFHGNGLAQVVTADGKERIRVPDADVRFDLFQGEPRFLAHTTESEMRTHTLLAEAASLLPGTEEVLVGIGASPSAVGNSESRSPSFWYTTQTPTVEVQGGGTVVAEGSFTVFVHDVSIHATGTDVAWSNWTGYREDDPTSPAGEYEYRVTTIQVTNGTFVSGVREGLRLFIPDLVAKVDGIATTLDVTGVLEEGNKRHIFRKDPLQLHGEGTLTVASTMAIELGRESSADRTALSLVPTGSFQMSGAGKVEVLESVDEPALSPLTAGGLGGLALVAMLGLMILGVVPAPTATTREHQSALWQRRGRAASAAGRWSRAARCFMVATRLKHDQPLAWYEWAQAELEGGHPEKAEAVAIRAADVPGIDPLDLLDLRASAAWQRGDQEAFQTHLRALAKMSPEMAQGLAADLGVDPSGLIPDTHQNKEALDGYA